MDWLTTKVPGRDGVESKNKPLDSTTVKRFLAGVEIRLACVPKNFASVIAIDFDDHADDPAVGVHFDYVTSRLRTLEMPFTYEHTPRGWHLFIRLTRPVPARRLKTWVMVFLRHEGLWLEGKTELFLDTERKLALPFGHGRTFVDGRSGTSILVKSPKDAREAFRLFECSSRVQPRRLESLGSPGRRRRGRPKTRKGRPGSGIRAVPTPTGLEKKPVPIIRTQLPREISLKGDKSLLINEIAVSPRPVGDDDRIRKYGEKLAMAFPQGLAPGRRYEMTFEAIRILRADGPAPEAIYWAVLEWLVSYAGASAAMAHDPRKASRDLWSAVRRYDAYIEQHPRGAWFKAQADPRDVAVLREHCSRVMAEHMARLLATLRTLGCEGDIVPMSAGFIAGVTGARNKDTRARIRELVIELGIADKFADPDRIKHRATLYRLKNVGAPGTFSIVDSNKNSEPQDERTPQVAG